MNYTNSNGLIMGFAFIVTDFRVTCSAASSAAGASAFAKAALGVQRLVAAEGGSFVSIAVVRGSLSSLVGFS